MKTIPVSCNKDCGAGCPLWAHMDEKGRIVKITDNPHRPSSMQGCIRGYNAHESLYAEDRIRGPLIRSGKRGSGEFREASWEEALDDAAEKLERIRKEYGPTAVLWLVGAGAPRGIVHNTAFLTARFLSYCGGFTRPTSSYSSAGAVFVTPRVFGTIMAGLDPATLKDSRLIILWGANVLVTRFGCELENHLREQKRRGTPIIVIDPRRSRTARTLGTEWIAVRPGSDSAFMAAVLHVLLRENLVEREFLDRYTTGFASLESYILGESDGTPKTPAWAENLCGTSADVIEDFALRYGSTKPAALIPGLSIQRTLGGEEAYRMAFALQAATGNTGIRGGSAGACIWGTLPMPRMPFLRPPDMGSQPSLPIYQWADAVLEGRNGGFPTDIRAIYSAGQNLVNQGSDITKNMRAFEKVDFAISHEIFLTPTARYCDIVLPATTFLEREDALLGAGNYLLYSRKATDPLYKSRNDYDIFCDLARRLGFHTEFSEEKTAGEWLEYLLGQSEINDVAEFRETGIYVRPEQNRVGFSDFILDPDKNPLTTPSGRIELSSEGCSAEGFPPHPVCRIEGPRREYPLFLITPHSPVRINSTGANLPWTEKLEPRGLQMHPEDAKPRRINGGDMVRVSSREGQTRVPVILREDIMPGTVCLPQGRWVHLDETGIDSAGSANVVTSTVPTLPSYGSRTHSVFVQVSKDS